MFELLISIICFVIFLYNLYYISHNDFLIIRKDIHIFKIFNTAFASGFAMLFFSRLFYVIFNPSSALINPLGFFSLTYLPGLSLSGGILGAGLFVYLYTRFNKLPIGKIIDLMTFSLISVLPVGFLLYLIIFYSKTNLIFIINFFVISILSVIFMKIIYKFTEKGEIKDGSFSLIFLSVFGLVFFLIRLFADINNFSFLDPENLVLFVLIFSSLVLLVNLEIIEKFLEK